jgi:hypothetical protein
MKLKKHHIEVLKALKNGRGTDRPVTRKEISDAAEANGISMSLMQNLIVNSPTVTRGVYDFSALFEMVKEGDANVEVPDTALTSTPDKKVVQMPVEKTYEQVYVPEVDPSFVRWGNYSDIVTIIKSGKFFPVFFTGLSGNGKTMSIEQACAQLKREYVRVQIHPETDEDDLLGGLRLINGDTVFEKGPVVKAMERGAVLLIDEIDRGSNKIMALQGVMEGKPVLIKKTGEVIKPKDGFTIFATANTLGRGSDTGHFITATVLDEAFLERFYLTIHQPYATEGMEEKILKKHGSVEEGDVKNLVKWANTIRKTFEDGGISDTMSTRRLCHIVNAYEVFGDINKAVSMCVSRFDEDTRDSFLDLWNNLQTEEVEGSAEPKNGPKDFTANPFSS